MTAQYNQIGINLQGLLNDCHSRISRQAFKRHIVQIFDQRLNMIQVILFSLSFFIVLTPGNIGIQEIAWGLLSEKMGIGMETGILMSGFVRLIGTGVLSILGITLGGVDLIRNRKSLLILSTKEHM